ncbi:MAG: LacI family DNA-binding transcriptional regulator [Anaerolineae bacterium]
MPENGHDSHKTKLRNVTIIDVARASGVSYSTVSRVLNGFEFVKESTRQRVLEAAEKLGYVANAPARSLAGGKSQTIGLLVPGLDNGYIGEIIRGVDVELARANYDLMIYTTHRSRGKESLYANTIANGVSDGLLLIVPLVPTNYLDALRERNFPCVLIDQSVTAEQSSVVDATNWQGAYEATRYLIELGHRRIAFITGLRELGSAAQRFEGYKDALTDNNIPVLDELIIEGDYWQPLAYENTRKFLNEYSPPTAIFAANDLSAFGAMEAIRNHGLRIPEDISIIGFDDIPQASIVYPKLTTIRQPLEQMGRVAVKLLLEQIENPDRQPRRVTLATQLIVRDSCQQYVAP